MGSDRYMELSLFPEERVGKEALAAAVEAEALSLLGAAGAAALDLWVYDVDGERAVVGCRKGEVGRARAVLACLTEVEGTKVAPTVRCVSGTIGKVRGRL